jgi:thiol-disulfide isomerase/thioredoxin
VNFWQSSCVPCIEEMPLLEEARADREDLTFVGVASQDRLEQAIELADQTGITYPWVQDPEGNLFFEARAAGMPTTILLDASGAIVATETGAFADRAELDAFLAEAG